MQRELQMGGQAPNTFTFQGAADLRRVGGGVNKQEKAGIDCVSSFLSLNFSHVDCVTVPFTLHGLRRP